MNDRIRERIDMMRADYKAGQEQLQQLDAQRNKLTESLLRLNGAIQVLEELLAEEEGKAGG